MTDSSSLSADDAPPPIRVEGLSVGIDGAPLLKNVSFTVPDNSILTLTGRSGCGKTTLLRALAQLDDALAGTIHVEGRPLSEWEPPQYRRRILYVQQRPALLDASVAANLERPFSYAVTTHSFDRDYAATLLNQFGVGADRLSQPARSLSEGQQQRVCLIRALLLRPAVLLLDEPTASLDPDSVAQIEQELKDRVIQNPLSIVAVTHNQAQARNWSHDTLDLTPFATSLSENVHAG